MGAVRLGSTRLSSNSPGLRWFGSHVAAGEHEDVEDVVHDGHEDRAVVLQRAERRPPVDIEGDDLPSITVSSRSFANPFTTPGPER